MKDHRSQFAVEKMCKVLNISRSGYYAWLDRKPSKRVKENKDLVGRIRSIHLKSRKTYGSPRITQELRSQDIKVSRPRIARLMKQEGIRSKAIKKFKVTTNSKHCYPVVSNSLNRDFQAERKGAVWVSDITYVPTQQGWLYLTIILDLWDRKVVGWALSDSLRAKKTSLRAWDMAIKNRPINASLLFHSDRGVQYCCHEFTDLLKKYPEVSRSMSRKGDCWDNAVAESFFKTIKMELVNRESFTTRKQAEISIFHYIEGWYNRYRRHSALGYLSPEEFERKQHYKNAA